ncbi:MAG: nucleotidyltransferase family protein [Bacteroidetes bacterium]|nr:nucleotidyltransferase family protein [Bacteroidota bacterium]MBU2585575.1 nucleotidyltransferase family protein [Bacteroidota bacterium]
MKSLEEIKAILKQHEAEIKLRYGVRDIGIFGSYLHNNQKRNSDLDILVEFNKAPGFFKFIELEDYLTEILGVKVDLVMKSALKPKIGEHILSEVVYL